VADHDVGLDFELLNRPDVSYRLVLLVANIRRECSGGAEILYY
jgi:hypothetical protein